MPTKIDDNKLETWKARLPKRLHIFMDNFFGTCERYDPAVNYLNYLNDIRLYSCTTCAYRDHADQLLEAFYEITDWRPGGDA